MPNINNIQRLLAGKKIFSALDLRHAYHHIEIKPEDRYKTAFRAPDGLWEWVRMGFGFQNAPAAMQRAADVVLKGIPNVIIYIDDVLIIAESEEEMLMLLIQVIQRFKKYNLKINLSKCKFFMKELKYLGHIISHKGQRPDPRYVQRIINLNKPNGVEDIKRIDGLINWLTRYIPHLSHKMEPINKLRRKGQPWIWEDDQIKAFKTIKEAVKNAKILKHPNLNKEFTVLCDASGYGTGAVLLQEYDGTYYPVEYYSQSLDESQRNWHISEKELVSCVWALEHWEKYLAGSHFHLFTDHRNLISLLNYENEKKVIKSKLLRWILRLQEFQYTAHYITGSENISDYFSRDITGDKRPSKIIDGGKTTINEVLIMKTATGYKKYHVTTPGKHHLLNLDKIINESKKIWEEKQKQKRKKKQKYKQKKVKEKQQQQARNKEIQQQQARYEVKEQEEEIESLSENSDSSGTENEYYVDRINVAYEYLNWNNILNMKEIQKQQEEDEILGPIIEALTLDKQINIKLLPRYVRKQYRKNMFFMKSGLLHFRNKYKAVIIPPKIRKNIMKYFHENYSSIHQSAKRVYKTMRKHIYWFGMLSDIKLFVQYCKTCKLTKTNAKKNQGYLQLFTPSKPFEIVGIDIVGPLPVTKQGNRYILSTIDKFSRYVHLIPLQTITAENIAYEFRSKYLLKYGIPQQVLSDRGSQFTGSIFKILCKLFGIDKLFTTAYHPQTNGMIERFHRFLKQRLRVISNQYKLDFVNYDDWDTYLAEIEFAYNNSTNEMTGTAPYQVIYGHILDTPVNKILNRNIDNIVEENINTINNRNDTLKLPQKVQSYVNDLKKRTKIIIKEMRANMDRYDKYRKQYYDKKRIAPIEYRNLERVLVDVSDSVKGNKKKLNINRKEGEIIDKLNDNVYVVQFDNGKRESINIERIYKIESNNEEEEYIM